MEINSNSFRLMADNAGCGILIIGNDEKIIFANRHVNNAFKYPDVGLEGKPIDLLFPGQVFSPDSLSRIMFINPKGLDGSLEHKMQVDGYAADGSRFPVEIAYSTSVNDESIFICPFTEHNKVCKSEENKTNITKKWLALIGVINKAIISSLSEEALFNEICKVAVEIGRYEVCWVGKPDIETKLYNPVASYNATAQDYELLGKLKIDTNGPTSYVMQTGNHYFSNDFNNEVWSHDLKSYLWGRDFRSYLCLPFKLAGKAVATFNVYASDINTFDAEQVFFLDEISNSISFALDNLENEKNRQIINNKLTETIAFLNHSEAIAHIGSWRISFKTGEAFWSDETCRIYGYEPTPNALSYIDWISAVHPDDVAMVKKIDNEARKTLSRVEKEHRIIRKDGMLRYVRSISFFETNTDNVPIGMYGVIYDITDKKEMDDALSLSEANLRLIMDMVPQCIYVRDYAGRFKFANKNYAALFGLTPEELISLNFIELEAHLVGNYSIVSDSDREVISSGLSKRLELMPFTDKKGKHLIFNVLKTPFNMVGTKEVFVLGILDNITDQVIAETERTRMLEDVVKRNEGLQQFSYIVSHNLRSPVANIIGLINAMKTPGMLSHSRERLMEGLDKSVGKLDMVIKDMNSILQIREGVNEQKQEVVFADLVDTVKISLNTDAVDSINIVTDFSLVNHIFEIKSYIYSVFHNLIANSIKYRQPDIPLTIEISSKNMKDAVKLIFKDNGLGIDLKKNNDELFGLYKRFHNVAEGKGMGLYMVKTQVERMGGSIHVSSEVNAGTEFKIIISTKQL